MLLDYVTEYSNVPFEEAPLNTLDVLVFTALAYFNYPQDPAGEPLSAALPRAVHFTVPDPHAPRAHLVDLERDQDEQLKHLVLKAARYQKVRVLGSANDFMEHSHQFAATAFLLDDVLVAAFQGTDESITGWREALELSRDTPGAGQLLAQQFLKEHATSTKGPIITCGHSKGGNLAAYAAVTCSADPTIAERMAAILSFDGPGLPPWMRATPSYVSVADRMSAYIPKSSIIGNIHEHPSGSVTYIDSKKMFTAQHLIYNWKTNGARFIPCKQSLAGKIGSGALNLLIDNMNDAQKDKLFDLLFSFPRRSSQSNPAPA